MPLALPGLDTVDDKTPFIDFIQRAIQLNQLTVCSFGPQFLAEPIGVLVDHGICGFKNVASRTVVLFEADNPGVGKILLQLMHILNPGTTPAINGLIVITHCSDLLVLLRQQFEPAVLDGVTILEFINQDVLEALLVGLPQRFILLQKFQHPKQQFSKID